MLKAFFRQYSFTIAGVVLAFVSSFFMSWNDGWSITLWIALSFFVCANAFNVLRASDRQEDAEEYYRRLVEARNAYASLQLKLKTSAQSGYRKVAEK